MKYLGIDFGLRKIGLAVGDDASGIALPFGVIAGGDDAPARIAQLVNDEGIEALVAGLPMPVEAFHTEDQLNLTMAFITQVADVTELPVHVVDEQFSSAEARRMQREFGAEAPEDAIAAMLILQAYLDEGRRKT